MSLKDILDSFHKVTAEGSTTISEWVTPYTFDPQNSHLHQFIFFLKPEVTAVHQGVHLDKIIELCLNKLKASGIEIGAVRVLGGSYLENQDIMVEHYGVISKISKCGVDVISHEAKTNLESKYKDDLAHGARVLGGHQFLAERKEFNPFSLLVLNDNLGTIRLAGGTYAMKIKLLGSPVILLNPFHAYQLVPYTIPGNGIIVLEGLSKLPWKVLRNEICGVTDPKDAAADSIRNILLTNKSSLGLKDVDKGSNGVHMSAGPLEGMVELQRFFSVKDSGHHLSFSQTNFGALLGSHGVSEENIKKLVGNPIFDHDAKRISAFDLTEESDAEKAATLLKSKL